jgi:hypothetical protein
MRRSEFNAYKYLLHRCLIVGIVLLAAGGLYLTFGDLSAKGYIVFSVWLSLPAFGTGMALYLLPLCKRMEATGHIED